MFTAKQFREKAAESAESLKHTDVPSEIRELQRSKRKLQLRWRKTRIGWRTISTRSSIRRAPLHRMTPLESPSPDVTVAEVEEHILRCLGAAVIMQWNTIPTKLQRELFDTAGSMGDVLKSAALRGRLPAFCISIRMKRARRLRFQTKYDERNASWHISSISVRQSSLQPKLFVHRPRVPMKFVISFLPRTEIRATRATASRVSPKNMNGSRVKAISRFRSAFSPEAIGA